MLKRALKALGLDIVRTRTQPVDLEAYSDLYDDAVLARRPFFNVGAGGFRHPYWTNLDKPSPWYEKHQGGAALIPYDLLELAPLPIETGDALLIYTSHTLEHVPTEAARHFFREAHRALAPAGLLRIVVPDADLLYRAYRSRDRYFDDMVRTYADREKARRITLNVPASDMSPQQLFLWRIASSVSVHHLDGSPERMSDADLDRAFDNMGYEDALDHCVDRCDLSVQRKYPGNHMNWWNWQKLSRYLRDAGFSSVWRSGYGQSTSPLMRDRRLFDSTHPEFSIYVEARKGLENGESNGP